MSEITVPRPEVINEDTDVIYSVLVRSRSLEYDNSPEISEANVLSTSGQLHRNKGEVFKRRVINVFEGLSQDYRTNLLYEFSNKIITNNLAKQDQWGFHFISEIQADRLVDPERMLHLLNGKPIPDSRGSITINLDDHIQSVQDKGCYEDEMPTIKYFKKGSVHIASKRLELIDGINDIVTRHFLSVLSVRPRARFPFDIKRDRRYKGGHIFHQAKQDKLVSKRQKHSSIPSPAPLISKSPSTGRVLVFGSDNDLREKNLPVKSGGITLTTLARVTLLMLTS